MRLTKCLEQRKELNVRKTRRLLVWRHGSIYYEDAWCMRDADSLSYCSKASKEWTGDVNVGWLAPDGYHHQNLCPPECNSPWSWYISPMKDRKVSIGNTTTGTKKWNRSSSVYIMIVLKISVQVLDQRRWSWSGQSQHQRRSRFTAWDNLSFCDSMLTHFPLYHDHRNQTD